MAIDLSYSALVSRFGKHQVKTGTESRAFLAWFLENYYRFEGEEIYDTVCDGHNDKGIDGLHVNEALRQIDIFQVKLAQSGKTQGDSKIKNFTGTIAQLNTSQNAETILASANPELKAIAQRVHLTERLEAGYDLRGIFVTNADADPSATTYLKTQPKIILYDGVKLRNDFITVDKTEPIAEEVSFDVAGFPVLPLSIGTNLRMIIAPIAAQELVGMKGISNGELFVWNVRQWLGKGTTVNKSVAQSIQDKSEHKFFPAFHNGVTVLCKKLTDTKDAIRISGYAVVNGCQSITSLYENRSSITPDLRLLTKFVEVEPDSDLAIKITDHTNNQNGTKARDLQSNSRVQTMLQTEIHTKYPEVHYRIKRGEHPEWEKDSVLENELLGRILLAFDLTKPEAWSQNYKLFDELHSEIFARKEVNADRAIFLYDAYSVVAEKLDLFDDKLFAQYTLTRWLLLYLLREALLTDELGKKLFADPSAFLVAPNGRTKLRECVGHVTQALVRLLNGIINRKTSSDAPYFDYKKELKNKEFVFSTKSQIIPNYQIVLDSRHTESFSDKWNATT